MSKRLPIKLFERIRMAYQALTAPQCVVEAQVGHLISYDPVGRRLVIQGDFEIYATGTLYLKSDRDVVLQSGHHGSEYTHDIHLNPELDEEDAIHLVCEPGSPGQSDLQSNGRSQGADASASNGNDALCCVTTINYKAFD